MKTLYCYPAIIQKEETGYSVWIPDIAGCNSCGETVVDALDNIKEALGLCIEVFLDEKKEIPEPSLPEKIKIEQNQFIAVVDFDWLEYQKKYCSKAVKKTLTIPSWLNEMAMQHDINFSAVLQNGLKQELHIQDRP